MEDCEVARNALPGIEVTGHDTRPTLRRCVARDGKQGGYSFHFGGGGLLDQCEAVGNAYAGVQIRAGADPLLRGCVLRDNLQSGLFVNDCGRGRLEDCVIERNGFAGVSVKGGGVPVVKACTIRGNEYQAIRISDPESGGTFENNDLRDNNWGPWDVARGHR